MVIETCRIGLVVILGLFFVPLIGDENLKLEALLEAPEGDWFPGQTANIVYKISYRGSIQLVAERLPLLDLSGFEKLGDKQFKDYREGGFAVQEISQKFRALTPGTFISDSSEISGFLTILKDGKRVAIPPPMSATVSAQSITVKPFPLEGKPPSFNGSIGAFHFLMSSSPKGAIRLGDWITLTVVAEGSQEDLSLLKAPDLICQPGFGGFFQIGDTPFISTGDTSNNQKVFQFKITPLNSLATEIPPISWSSFDPIAKKYLEWVSQPIPIEIVGGQPLYPPYESERSIHLPPFSIQPVTPLDEIPLFKAPGAFETLFSLLEKEGFWFVLALLAATLVAMPLLNKLRTFLEKRKSDPLHKYRRELFHTTDSSLQLRTWDRLLTEQLQGRGLQNERGEWLVPLKGLAEEVESFLQTLRRGRFTPKKGEASKEVASLGRRLLEQISSYRCSGFIFPLLYFGTLGALDVNDHILRGNHAASWNERNKEWNSALQNLLNDPAIDTFYGNKTAGFLYQELSQLPLAILYYERAKAISPTDPFVNHSLQSIRLKGGIIEPEKEPLPLYLFSLISVGQWWALGLISTLALAIFLLFFSERHLAVYSLATLSGLIFLAIAARDTLLPIKAIVMEHTHLYMEPTLQNQLDLPLLSGELVRLVGFSGQNSYQILSSNGRLGYISQNVVRPIRVPQNHRSMVQ